MSRRTYGQHCGIARTFDLVGERWTLLIVRELLLGPKRYSDLLDGLPGLTTNLLARRLKDMERDGLIERTRLPAPSRVRAYHLTPLGMELETLLLAACRFGGHVMPEFPDDGETVSLSSCLLRMKVQYRGGQRMIFEIRVDDETVYHVKLEPGGIIVGEGPHPAWELRITGAAVALCRLFSGASPASEFPAGGEVVVEGRVGRWPRMLAGFGLS